MPGQLPCCGCGFDAISCDRVSLLMNVTVCPTATVTDAGLTPLAVIVTVAPLAPPVPPSRTITAVPPPPGLLPPPLLPPQADSTPSATSESTNLERRYLMVFSRRTCGRC